MRDGLLSIGELARMKGVGVKSLRYYESIGIFRPAFVDPSSGYRYYSLNQLMDLDAITTCIELGIPLKELRDYIEPSGMLDLAALLEHGRCRALASHRRSPGGARPGERPARRDQRAACVLGKRRALREPRLKRAALVQDWAGESFDVRRYARWMTEAYGMAKRIGMVPRICRAFCSSPSKGRRPCGTPTRPLREGGRWARMRSPGCEGSSFAYAAVRAPCRVGGSSGGGQPGSSNAADP